MEGIRIKQLVFTGEKISPEKLEFADGLNLIWGASNTGKSFFLIILDYMLGGEKLKKDIPELDPYSRIWLSLELRGRETITLSRSTKGGSFEVYDGVVSDLSRGVLLKTLGATQSSKDSLSQHLLNYLNLYGRVIAKNKSGDRENLSFRNIVKYSLVDEGSILSEISPVESGDKIEKTKERRVFGLVLSGQDDSDIVEVVNPKKFATSKAARIDLIQELLSSVENELKNSYPDEKGLLAESNNLSNMLQRVQSEFNQAQSSVSHLLKEKGRLSADIPKKNHRIGEINIHLNRFSKLDEVYLSDIERLEALEEAGFFLSLEEKACGVCGSPPGSHTIKDVDIKNVRAAAIAEISKIQKQRKELEKTVHDLNKELDQNKEELPALEAELLSIEKNIADFTPRIDETRNAVNEIIAKRDHVQRGIALIGQRKEFSLKLNEILKEKQPSKADRPVLSISSTITYNFSKVVSEVLKEWGFPGENNVNFDAETYDVKIDGKLRTSNGKGVRAVTHAAFKVAILIYCHRNKLPHPGFIILDSPLLTYRDPIKNTKLGELTEDEKALKKTDLKDKFFNHLSTLSDIGQFIVLENIDPPNNIKNIAHVETFYGTNDEGRRFGLFPELHKS